MKRERYSQVAQAPVHTLEPGETIRDNKFIIVPVATDVAYAVFVITSDTVYGLKPVGPGIKAITIAMDDRAKELLMATYLSLPEKVEDYYWTEGLRIDIKDMKPPGRAYEACYYFKDGVEMEYSTVEGHPIAVLTFTGL